jgi:hypothetical protein
MWGTKTLERARRHLGLSVGPAEDRVGPAEDRVGRGWPTGGLATVATVDATEPDDVPRTITIAFTRSEKDAFATALAKRLGGDTVRLDSPARVASALVVAIDRAGGQGRPHVVRRPAGLYTPEYWEVSVQAADRRARAEVEHLVDVRRVGA